MSLAPGTRLGPYEVLSHIDAGGMGEVYRARDPRLERDVALKIVAPDIASDEVALARFEREARAVARLSHPNILAIYDIGTDGGVSYAVMELLQGETLRQRLAAGALPVRKAIDIGAQIARGLASAHQAGLVHRDLKPENVILTRDGQVKVLDFGLARTPHGVAAVDPQASTIASEVMTGPGVAVGTPAYMAPEQVQGMPLDQRCDIFGLGAVLYELLTGYRAFQGRSKVDVLHAVLYAEPDTTALAHLPPGLQRTVLRCLEKRADERFSSAGDLAFALEAAGDAVQGTGRTGAVAANRSGTRTVAALVALACLAVGVAGGYLVSRRSATRQTEVPRSAAARLLLDAPPEPRHWWVASSYSPDGRSIAIVADGESKQGPSDIGPYGRTVWVRSLADSQWRAVAPSNDGTWEYLVPLTWSPDSRSVLYQVSQNGAPELRIVDPSSSAVHPLARTEAAGAAWSAASGILVGGRTIRRVSADGRVDIVLAGGPSIEWQRWPSFLPDGEWFVYAQQATDESQRGIFLGKVGSTTVTRLSPVLSNAAASPLGYLVYGADGNLVARRFDLDRHVLSGEPEMVLTGAANFNKFTWFSIANEDILAQAAGVSARSQLVTLDRSGVSLGTVAAPDSYKQIQLSPDATHLAVDRGMGDIGTIDLARGVFAVTARSRTAVIEGPTWSPDGRQLAASVSEGERYGGLVIIDVASGQVGKMLVPGVWPTSWTRDGQILVKKTEGGYQGGIWSVPLKDPQASRRLTPEGPFTMDQAVVSPDGRSLAYSSNETGTSEVYLQPFDGSGARRRVSTDGGCQPQWRDDGQELFYLKPDGTLMTAAIAASLEPGVPTRLFTIRRRPDPSADEYVVLPKARRFIAIVPQEREGVDFTVLTRWPSVLSH